MGGSMDRALQEAMNRRNAQLDDSMVQHAGSIKQAEGWLGRKKAPPMQPQQASQPEPVRQLKIGKELPRGTTPVETIGGEYDGRRNESRRNDSRRNDGRQVHFATTTPEQAPLPAAPEPDNAVRFLNSLKKEMTSVSPEDLMSALKRIEDAIREIPATLRELSTNSHGPPNSPVPSEDGGDRTPPTPPSSPQSDEEAKIDSQPVQSVWKR